MQTWLHKANPTYSRARPKNKTKHAVRFPKHEVGFSWFPKANVAPVVASNKNRCIFSNSCKNGFKLNTPNSKTGQTSTLHQHPWAKTEFLLKQKWRIISDSKRQRPLDCSCKNVIPNVKIFLRIHVCTSICNKKFQLCQTIFFQRKKESALFVLQMKI